MEKVSGMLLLVLFSSLWSCKSKDDDGPALNMPDATREGRNTLGCLINDNLYVAYKGKCTNTGIGNITGNNGKGSALTYTSTDKDSMIEIVITTCLYYCNSKEYVDKAFVLRFEVSKKVPQDYVLDYSGDATSPEKRFFNASYADSRQNCTLEFSPANAEGLLSISRIDPAAHIVSGTFYIKTKPSVMPNACNTFNIREGRFDLHY